MSKILFLSSPNVYDVLFNKIGEHQIRLKFISEIPEQDILSGFNIINEHNGVVMTKFEDYRYLYRTYADDATVIELCNDGVEYVDPEPTVTPKPPERHEPTEEELQKLFDIYKSEKINESKELLELYLSENPLISTCHGGVRGVYTVTTKKQTLMGNNYLTYTIAKQSGENTVLMWNESGKECEEWTENEYIQLVLEVSNYVKPLVAAQQKYEVLIKNCLTQDDLDSIILDYSSINNL